MAQIKKKFLAPNVIDGSKLQFLNDESFRVKSSSNDDVELFKLDSSNVFQFMQMPRVSSDPTEGNDVSRKSYVDAQVMNEAAARVQADAAEQAARELAVAELQASIAALSLDSLTDVELGVRTQGDVLYFDGGKWAQKASVQVALAGSAQQIPTYTSQDFLRILRNGGGTLSGAAVIISSSQYGGQGGPNETQLWVTNLGITDSVGSPYIPYVTWTTTDGASEQAVASQLAGKYLWIYGSYVNIEQGLLVSSFQGRFPVAGVEPTSYTEVGPTEDFQVFAAETLLNGAMLIDLGFPSTSPYYNNVWIGDTLQIFDGSTINSYQVVNYQTTTPEWHVISVSGPPTNLNAGSTIYKEGLQVPSGEYRVYIDPTQGFDINNWEYIPAPGNAGSLIRSNESGYLDTSFLQYNVNFGGNKLSGVSAPEMGTDAANKEWVEGQVAAEASSRETGDANLQAQLDALSGGSSANLAQEIADRQAGDSNLQSQIDAILLASDADKDSFAEIVQLINSVDTENDSAFAGYVLSNDAALAQEVSDRQAGDSAEQAAREAADSVLQSNIDSEASARQAADTAEESARTAADTLLQSNIDAEATARAAGDDALSQALATETSNRQAADTALAADLADEVTRATTAEDALDSKIDQEIVDRSAAVSAEQAAREAADSVLDSRLDVLEGSDTTEGSVAKAEKDAKDHADSIVATEQAAREAADSDLQDAIDAEASARSAADTTLQANIDVEKGRIDAILLASDADKDSFAEIVQLINSVDTENDSAFASYVLSNNAALAQEVSDRQAGDSAEQAAREAADSVLQGNIDSEASARQAADDALQSALDQEVSDRQAAVSAEQSAREAADAAESAARTAELPRHAKVRMTLSATDISNGWIDLDHVALGNSTHVFIDRLACHETDDYTLSVVDGKTRVTFSESFMTSGEAPGEGDLFRCGYMYKNSDQV